MTGRSTKAGLAAGALACAAAVACQPYNMEEVTPQTIVAVETSQTFVGSKPPVLLIVQDRSGSMDLCFGEETLAAGQQCKEGVASRPGSSRMHVAQEVMREALGAHLDDAFYGLILYGVSDDPSEGCGGPRSTVSVNTLEAPRTTAEIVRTSYQSDPNIVVPRGGTPSAAALAGAYEALVTADGELRFPDRHNYVVLITDGLMNCNANHVGECICSQENGCNTTAFGDVIANPSGQNLKFCLDDVAATQQVNQLLSKEISTFVIGLGESFEGNPLAITTLNTLSNAGGKPRVPTAAGDIRTFYPASDRVGLQESIDEIINSITAPCEYYLDGPVCEGRLVAINLSIDGTPVATTCNADYANVDKSWFFVGGDPQKITFSEDICSALREATQVDVSIRGVETACQTPDGLPIQPACSLAAP